MADADVDAAAAAAATAATAAGELHARWQSWPLLRWSFMHMEAVCPASAVHPAAVPSTLPAPPPDALRAATAALLQLHVRRRLCLAFPHPSWLRHCLCLTVQLQSDYGDSTTVGAALQVKTRPFCCAPTGRTRAPSSP